MGWNFTRHERIWLSTLPDFSEDTLQDLIAKDPSMLGLGAVEILERERRHPGAGRLDLLLADPSGSPRYEVELMLGATDPSHIVRCLEYWDIERRRYAAYDHVAVLVAEDVTSRFLNIMSLFAGNVPLIALQLNALKVGDQLVLDFVRVLDQTSLRRDDDTTSPKGKSTTRSEWVDYAGEKMMGMIDKLLGFINEKVKPQLQLNYKQQHIGLTDGRRVNNFIWFEPRKSFSHIGFVVNNAPQWKQRVEDAELPATADGNRLRLTVRPDEFAQNEGLIRELALQAVEEFQA